MDARLQRIHGQRPVFLRGDDVPVLTRALVGFSLNRVRARSDFVSSVPVVILEGPGLQLLVRKEDWDKITPWLKDPSFYPNPSSSTSSNYNAKQYTDGPEEAVEPELYQRIFDQLSLIFTEFFPTAK